MHVDFKIATLIYCSLSGMASAYLVTDCQLLYDEGRRHLRSANLFTCTVPLGGPTATLGTYVMYLQAQGLEQPSSGLRQMDIGYEQSKWLLDAY